MFKKVACLAVVGAAMASTGANAAHSPRRWLLRPISLASCTLATNPLAFGSFTTTNTAPSGSNGRQVQVNAVVDLHVGQPLQRRH